MWWLVAITTGLVGGHYGSYDTEAACKVRAAEISAAIDKDFATEEHPYDKREDYQFKCVFGEHPPSTHEKID